MGSAQTVNVLLPPAIRCKCCPRWPKIYRCPLRDTGLVIQSTLYQQLLDLGQQPAVLDSKALLQNPHRVLEQLCAHIGIPFDERVLSWQAGARPEDGVWAKYWYNSVHQSTGFERYRAKPAPFPPRLLPLLAQCRPHYEQLAAVALQA
ncbi:MAG: hypothetical protein R2932_47960 [Caldilineaceae bacterium]